MSGGRATLALGLALAIALGLGGCGKKGSPEAPGPGDKIIYPHTYPAN